MKAGNNETRLESFGSSDRTLRLRRKDVRALIEVGVSRVQQGVKEGLLAWLPKVSSKRYAMFVAFAGVGQSITDDQNRDLAGVVYGILHGREAEDWAELKHEGRALSIRWAATSRINSNPTRGFVAEQGDGYVCPLW